MTYLILAIIFAAAGSLVTYGVMKSSQAKVNQASKLTQAERDKLCRRNQELEAQASERRVTDAYHNGYNSRNREVTDLQRENVRLREQITLEAMLDERSGGPGRQGSSGSKVINIHGGRG